jgi:hypothetical protein
MGADDAASKEQGALRLVERLLEDETTGNVLDALGAAEGGAQHDGFKHHIRRLALVPTRELLRNVITLLDDKAAERDPQAQCEALDRRFRTLDKPDLVRLLGLAAAALLAHDRALEAYIREHLASDAEAGELSLLRAALIRLTASLSRHEEARKPQQDEVVGRNA